MRRSAIALVLPVVAAAIPGCFSGQPTKPPPAVTKASDSKPCSMQSGGREVLRVSVPTTATCTAKDSALHLESAARDAVDIWLVPGARTVDEAVPRISGTIKPEFKGFKSTGESALTVASAPAKRLSGTGTEADDGDPGTADVIIFKAGPNIFIACTHAETLASSAREWLLSVVQTATAP